MYVFTTILLNIVIVIMDIILFRGKAVAEFEFLTKARIH